MPTPPKTAANSTKHYTQEEREQRELAEQVTMPSRGKPRRAPTIIAADKKAKGYWDRIWADMEELEILDVLDAHALASLCSMMAMRDRLALLTPKLMDQLEKLEQDANATGKVVTELAAALKFCSALSDKRLKLETQILSYAEKLGLTPSGRARLAARKAVEEPSDPDDDLFG